jgi:hypothetical protein
MAQPKRRSHVHHTSNQFEFDFVRIRLVAAVEFRLPHPIAIEKVRFTFFIRVADQLACQRFWHFI